MVRWEYSQLGSAGKSSKAGHILNPLNTLATVFSFHKVEEITQKLAILDLIQILSEEMVENLKVEVNWSERDHKNDKSSTLRLNCK